MWLLGRLGCVSLLPYLIPPSDYWRNSLTMAGVLLSFVPAPHCQLAALRSYFSPCGCSVEGCYLPTTPCILLVIDIWQQYRPLALTRFLPCSRAWLCCCSVVFNLLIEDPIDSEASTTRDGGCSTINPQSLASTRAPLPPQQRPLRSPCRSSFS